MKDTYRPSRCHQEMGRRNKVLLSAFRATGLSRYTDGRQEWAKCQSEMRTNRKAWRVYKREHYPAATNAEQQRAIAFARAAYIANAMRRHSRRSMPRRILVVGHRLQGNGREGSPRYYRLERSVRRA